MNNAKFDIIIIGLGAAGAAAAYQLSKTNKHVLGIDRFSPPHIFGSSTGDSRITREAIGEGAHYVPTVMRSHQIWREIEAETGFDLLTQCGGVLFGSDLDNSPSHGSTGFLDVTIKAAEQFGIKYEALDAAQLMQRFPQFKFNGDEVGYYEPGAGFLRPEKCVEAQLKLAKENGVELVTDSEVKAIDQNAGEVKVSTASGDFTAGQVVLCVGAWVKDFIPQNLAQNFRVIRQVQYWFEPEIDYAEFSVEKCPIFIRLGQKEEDMLYGFPTIDGSGKGVKVASEQYLSDTTPESISRDVDAAEIESSYKHISKVIKISNQCVKTKACLYTNTPDFGFVIDRMPNMENVLLVSPCSGHGFKHSAAIGEIVRDLLLTQKTDFDISKFKLARFSDSK